MLEVLKEESSKTIDQVGLAEVDEKIGGVVKVYKC